MTLRRLVIAAVLIAAAMGTPATAVETLSSAGDRWGCLALDGLGGFCLSSPLGALGL